MKDHMTCPCCGGTIELENDSEGVCDTCMTFMAAGEIVKDPNYAPEEGSEEDD